MSDITAVFIIFTFFKMTYSKLCTQSGNIIFFIYHLNNFKCQFVYFDKNNQGCFKKQSSISFHINFEIFKSFDSIEKK